MKLNKQHKKTGIVRIALVAILLLSALVALTLLHDPQNVELAIDLLDVNPVLVAGQNDNYSMPICIGERIFGRTVAGEFCAINRGGELQTTYMSGDSGYIKNGIVYIYNNAEIACFTLDGTELAPELFYNNYLIDSSNSFKRGSLAPQENENGALGFINQQGFWIIQPEYAMVGYSPKYKVENFSEGYAIVREKGSEKQGILNVSGEFVELCLQGGSPSEKGFSNGMLKYEYLPAPEVGTIGSRDYRYTFITKENKCISKVNGWEDAQDFSEGLAAVKQNNLWGYIDEKGNYAIQSQYKMASSFENGVAGVWFDDGSIGQINKKGEEISGRVMCDNFTGEYHDELFLVGKSGEYRLLGMDGSYATDEETYSNIIWKDAAWRVWQSDHQTGIVLTDAKKVIISDTTIKEYKNIFIAVNKGKYRLYSSTSGELLQTLDYIGAYSEGLSPAKVGKKYGYIDLYGKWVIEPQFTSAEAFHGGLAYVVTPKSKGFIANPQMYPQGWSQELSERAKLFGLPEISDKGFVVSEQFNDLIIAGHSRLNELSLVPPTSNKEYALAVPESQKVLWKDACLALTKLSNAQGIDTMFLYTPENLAKTLTEEERGAVGYIASLGLIDFNDFSPLNKVTASEATGLVLGYCEMLADK